MKRTWTALALALGSRRLPPAPAAAATTPTTGRSPRRPRRRRPSLKISDTSTPGKWAFDTQRLTAKAGKVTIELHNDSGLGHNVRVHTGKCCFKPGYKDLGGTAVIGATSSDKRDTIRATLDLKPGTYTFLCSIAGHFQAGQRGTLVVS